MRALILLLTLGLASLYAPSNSGSAGTVCLRTTQIGYLPAEQKVALALTDQDLRNQTFRIVKNPGGATVFTGTVGVDRGAYGSFSHVYELDFSAPNIAGRYSVSHRTALLVPASLAIVQYPGRCRHGQKNH
jgi:hypothetical protein